MFFEQGSLILPADYYQTEPPWPPSPFDQKDWPDDWFRFEQQYPGSGHRSRLVAHWGVPYVEEIIGAGGMPDADMLRPVAARYLLAVETYLVSKGQSLDLPAGWLNALTTPPDSDQTDEVVLQWLDIWPPVGNEVEGPKPQIASWNLSREGATHGLPAPIIFVAAEVEPLHKIPFAPSIGMRVPMSVTAIDGGFRVTIRSLTGELPKVGLRSFTESFTDSENDAAREKFRTVGRLISPLFAPTGTDAYDILGDIASGAFVESDALFPQELWLTDTETDEPDAQSVEFKFVSKALGALNREPRRLSYGVVSTLVSVEGSPNARLINTETCALVAGASKGEADVFVQPPPGWIDPAEAAAPYDWTLRRPMRSDDILEKYTTTRKAGNVANVTLDGPGFEIRLCPEYVPEDKNQPGEIKTVDLPADGPLAPPRSNEFTALNAYFNARDFFDRLTAYGIEPSTFVVRAEEKIQIFYRAGITPGPGKSGKTINAQVAYDCNDSANDPPIRMNLALAELTKWARPKSLDKYPEGRPEPLGIASSGRWMAHEFGHYLLAARIGQLEFDFAHGPGDALAAVSFDPESRLADTRGDVAESFRGVTYPFVFSTRRHDRTPLLGWAWYGTLNRSIIEAPVTDCEVHKGYITEQILSSTIFHLYRALGGDTMSGDGPDRYARQRAAFMTLFLLIKAIEEFAQSPSTPEMLELGMEDAGLLNAGDLKVVPQSDPPHTDVWKGGVTHKVVRWAFEAQGMFPKDPEIITNDIGQAPEVDIYIKDHRPLEEPTTAGPLMFGPGSYRPVSLDWGSDPLWTSTGLPVVIGNRGADVANLVHARAWVGTIDKAPGVGRNDLSAKITWDLPLGPVPIGDIAATDLQQPDFGEAVTEFESRVDDHVVLLIEISCPDDRANTDPFVGLAVEVRDGIVGLGDLPKTPRALSDLVANDNNLGLWVSGL